MEELVLEEQSQEPTLSDERKSKLRSVVQQAIDDGQDDEFITELVKKYKQKYSTIPVATEPKKKPATQTTPAATPAKPTGDPRQTSFGVMGGKLTPNVSDTPSPLAGVDEQVAVEDRKKAENEKNRELNKKKAEAAGMRNANRIVTDIKAAKTIANDMRNQYLSEVTDETLASSRGLDFMQAGAHPMRTNLFKNIDESVPKVNEKDASALRDELSQTPEGKAKLLETMAKLNPGAANEIQADAYEENAATGDKRNQTKIAENAALIRSGKYGYDFKTGSVYHKQGAIEAASKALDKRENEIKNYERLTGMSDKGAIAFLDSQIEKERDPDDVKDMPVGAGVITSGLGSYAPEMAKSFIGMAAAGVTLGTSAVAGESLVAKDFYQRSYYNTIKDTYARLVDEGMSKEDAYLKAKTVAEESGLVDAVVNTAANVVGMRAGMQTGKGFMGAIKKALPEASAVTGLSGVGEVAKNIAEQKEGIGDGDLLAGAGDAMQANAAMMLGFVAAGKVLSGAVNMGSKATKALFHGFVKADPVTLKTELAHATAEGVITPDQAKQIEEQVAVERELDARVPSSIKDPDARIKAQDIVQKLDALEAEKERAPKALHEDIDERIEAQKLRFNDLKNPKPEERALAKEASEVPESFGKIEVEKESDGSYYPMAALKGSSGKEYLRATLHEVQGTFNTQEEARLAGEKVLAERYKKSQEYKSHEEADAEIGKLFADDLKMDKMSSAEKKEGDISSYVAKAKNVLSELFPDYELRVYDKADDYYMREGRPEGSGGYYNPNDKRIALNLELSKGDGSTAFHEVIHPIIDEVRSHYEGNSMIDEMYDTIQSKFKDDPALKMLDEHESFYRGRGRNIEKIEVVTEFIAKVADGKIDASKIDKEFMTKVFELVNKALEAMGVKYRISTANDLRALSDAAKKSFSEGDATALANVLGKRIENKQTDLLDALKQDRPEVYEKVKTIVTNAKASTTEQLVSSLSKYMPEQEARDIVAEVRGGSKVSVIRPGEPKKREIVTIAPKAEESSTTKTIPDERQEKGQEGLLSPDPTPEELAGVAPEGIGEVNIRKTDEQAERRGLPKYEKKPETKKDWWEEADKKLEDNPNAAEDIIKGIEEGLLTVTPSDIYVLKRKAGEMEAALEADPFNDALLAEYARYKRAENLGISNNWGKVGIALQQDRGINETPTQAEMMFEKMEKSGVDKLTEQQKKEVITAHEEIKKANDEYAKKIAELEQKQRELEAENALLKEKKSQPKKESKTKKTHEDYVTERKKIVDEAREALRKARGQSNITLVPYANELIAITPHVAKMVKSLAEEGIDNISEIAKRIKENFEEDIPDLREEDVVDMIAGAYNQKRPTQSQLNKQMRDLRTEAELLSKIRDIEENGIPDNPKKEVEVNQRIAELRKKYKELTRREAPEPELNPEKKKASEETRLKSVLGNANRRIKELEEKLANKDFEPDERTSVMEDAEVQKKYPELFKEAEEALVAKGKAMHEWELQKAKDEYSKRKPVEKGFDVIAKVASIPREIEASFDFSFGGKQGLVLAINNPKIAWEAFKAQFRAAGSQKFYDDWFHKMAASPMMKLAKDSGLRILDPNDPNIIARGEEYLSGGLSSHIPIAGRAIRASERGFMIMANKLRLDKFTEMAKALESAGYTPQNRPDLYKGWASAINNETGAGGLGYLERAAGALSSTLFSPRLWASRLNLLGLTDIAFAPIGKKGFYGQLPKEIRYKVMGDMVKTIAAGMTVLGTAKAMGADVETDPRSSDFGKIKIGDTRYDIWGGFSQNIVGIVQAITNSKIPAGKKKPKSLSASRGAVRDPADVPQSMFRMKLAPLPALATDLFSRKTSMGEKMKYSFGPVDKFFPTLLSPKGDGKDGVNLTERARDFLFPMGYDAFAAAATDPGVKSSLDVILNIFGVSVNDYSK